MKEKLFTEENIIKGIHKNERKVLKYVYAEYFLSVKRMVMKNMGFSEEDAWDIFQDAMVILLKKIRIEKIVFLCTV